MVGTMNIKQFTALVKDTMQKSGDLDVHTAKLSKPAGNLIAQYGPLTDRITKQGSVDKAQEIWGLYKTNQIFVDAVDGIADVVSSLGNKTTNDSVLSMGALDFLNKNFDKLMGDVLLEVKPADKKLQGFLLAAMDAGITAGLAFVPVAGPFLVPLSEGIGAMLTTGIGVIPTALKHPSPVDTSLQVSTDLTTAMTNGFGKDSALGKLAAQQGVASLVATGIGIMLKKNEESVLKNCNENTPFTKMMLGQIQTQNQAVASEINGLASHKIELPSVLRGTSDRTSFYMNEEKTLDDFKNKTNEMYREFYGLISRIINMGIMESFADPVNKMGSLSDATGKELSNSKKIALLILGYYYNKDWTTSLSRKTIEMNALNSTLKSQQSNLHNYEYEVERLENDMKTGKLHAGEIAWNKGMINKVNKEIADQLGRINQATVERPAYKKFWDDQKNQTAHPSAKNAYTDAMGALKKGSFSRTSQDQPPSLAQMTSKAKVYFNALKDALVADATSGMRSAVLYLSKAEMQQMWKLYIASNLIINQAMRDAALKTESKFTRFTTKLSPRTASTLIDERYIQMLWEAGFIEYHSKMSLDEKDKKDLAAKKKLRWRKGIVGTPSDAERAMVVTFCTIVAFSLDVGKISLGFVKWSDTLEALGEVCVQVSASRY